MTDRADFIRSSMRQSWGQRYRCYAQRTAPTGARISQVLMGLVRPRPGERVLDVATGPGPAARAAAVLVQPGGEVLATDLTPDWEEVVREECQTAGITNLRFQAMSADALAVPDDCFDVATCQMGLMFVPDPVQALREMRRALRPGGRLGVAVWSTIEKVPYFTAARILSSLAPPPPPEERLPGPTDLGAPGLIEGQVAVAGFQDVAVHHHVFDLVAESTPEEEWRTFTANPTPSVAATLARMTPEQLEQARQQVIEAYAQYRQGDRYVMPSEVIYVTATKG